MPHFFWKDLSEIPASHWATRSTFFLAGFIMAVWAGIVPAVKAALGLNEGEFGLVLLMIGLGALATMPFSGMLVARFGAKRVLSLAVPSTIVLLAAAGFASEWVREALLTAAILFSMGAVFGAIDVSMNIHSVVVEARSGRRLLSGFHAMYSIGSVAGALAMTALLRSAMVPVQAALVLEGAALLLWSKTSGSILPDAGLSKAERKERFTIPRGIVLWIGAVCFISFMAEGSVLDWGALFLMEEKGSGMENAGLGFALFNGAMTIMRFAGDRIITRFGPARTLRASAVASAAAFALAVAAPTSAAACAAFFVLGLGAANIVPIAFAAAGHQKEMPMSAALSAATTIGYAGLLSGPAVIGAVAHATSISTAFLGEAALLLAVAAGAGALGRPRSK